MQVHDVNTELHADVKFSRYFLMLAILCSIKKCMNTCIFLQSTKLSVRKSQETSSQYAAL